MNLPVYIRHSRMGLLKKQKDTLEALWNHPDTQDALEARMDPIRHNYIPDPTFPVCFSCGCSEVEHRVCQVRHCTKQATWQGWYRARDHFGVHTGLLQRLDVCAQHECLLEGERDE